jgi:hypothetical protein
MSRSKNRTRKVAMNFRVALLAASATAAVCLAGPARAATPDHELQDVTGATFTCAGTVLTAVSGELAYDYHVVVSAAGVERDNGTGVPRDVTLTNSSGARFSLRGAFAYTDKYDPATGDATAGTVTDNLVVLDTSGGVLGRVGLVEHLDRNGRYREVHLGACTDDN